MKFGGTFRQLEESIAAEKKATELEPTYLDAWISLGVSYEESKKFPDAERCYRKAVALKPDCYDAVGSLGDILRQQGKTSEGRTWLLRARKCPECDPIEVEKLLRMCDEKETKKKEAAH